MCTDRRGTVSLSACHQRYVPGMYSIVCTVSGSRVVSLGSNVLCGRASPDTGALYALSCVRRELNATKLQRLGRIQKIIYISFSLDDDLDILGGRYVHALWDPANISWVGPVLHMSCTACHNSSRAYFGSYLRQSTYIVVVCPACDCFSFLSPANPTSISPFSPPSGETEKLRFLICDLSDGYYVYMLKMAACCRTQNVRTKCRPNFRPHRHFFVDPNARRAGGVAPV